jgi:hypothetical protein
MDAKIFKPLLSSPFYLNRSGSRPGMNFEGITDLMFEWNKFSPQGYLDVKYFVESEEPAEARPLHFILV